MSSPRIGSVNVKNLISLYENKSAEAGKTSNGHSVSQRQTLPASSEKTVGVIKEKLPEADLSKPQEPKKRFFEGFKPPPPPPDASAWKNEIAEPEQIAQAVISEQQEQSPSEKTDAKINAIWQNAQPKAENSQNQPRVDNPTAPIGRSREKEQLSERLSNFRTAIRHLSTNKKLKLAMGENGQLRIVKRKFGFTGGRSSSTRKLLAELRKLGGMATNSGDANLMVQYNSVLKELRATPWGKALEKNNSDIKTEFKQLTKFMKNWLEGGAPSGKEISEALGKIINSTNRQELKEALSTLTEAKEHLALSENANAEAIDKGIRAAESSLRQVDSEVFVAHLLGRDPDTEGREILLSTAGWVVKGQEFVEPLQAALQQISEMPPEQATQAFSSLADAAMKLSTAPQKDLNALNHAGNTLSTELNRIKDLALQHSDSAVVQQGRALELLLSHENLVPEITEQVINDFRFLSQQDNLLGALLQAQYLAFLPANKLDLPLNATQANSPTLREELTRVRDWGLQQETSEAKNNASILGHLLNVNKEIISQEPVTVTIKDNPLKKADIVSNVRSGNLQGEERENLLNALTAEFRAQFETVIAEISQKEFINAAWGKEGANAPNLIRAANSLNKTTYDIEAQILNSSDFKEATQLMQFYTELLDKCIEDKNYYGGMTILSALNAAPVSRFLAVVLNKEQQAIMQNADKVFSTQSSSKILREATAEAFQGGKKPIPSFPYLLTDLTFIEESSSKINDLINLDKADLIQRNIQLFAKYRDGLGLRPNRESDFFQVQDATINNGRGKDFDAQAFNRSLELMSRKELNDLKAELGVS
ncbi:hypothetical protein PHSC3_001436 [Chlamydiales bacterium STE3]|nr:hypothetical protein PHSC3_001436 [Chlamydiales bacterium STE3]